MDDYDQIIDAYKDRARDFGQLSQVARQSGDYSTAYAALKDALHWAEQARDMNGQRLAAMERMDQAQAHEDVAEREYQAAKQEYEEGLVSDMELSCGSQVTLLKNGTLLIGSQEVDAAGLLAFLQKAMQP